VHGLEVEGTGGSVGVRGGREPVAHRPANTLAIHKNLTTKRAAGSADIATPAPLRQQNRFAVFASQRLGDQKPNAKAQSRKDAAAETPNGLTGEALNAESAPLAGAQSEEAHFVAP
jgi:hypothetical protein